MVVCAFAGPSQTCSARRNRPNFPSARAASPTRRCGGRSVWPCRRQTGRVRSRSGRGEYDASGPAQSRKLERKPWTVTLSAIQIARINFIKISSTQTGPIAWVACAFRTGGAKRIYMAADPSTPMRPAENAIPKSLLNVCFVLAVVNASFFPAAYYLHCWIYDLNGQGIPTDFVNVWAAGRMVLDGHPALAYDWDLQKRIELDVLKQDFNGYFAWHYPPPFLFVAAFLAQFPYSVAFIGWVSASILPYIAVMRLIVGRAFGLLLAVAFPLVFSNAL